MSPSFGFLEPDDKREFITDTSDDGCCGVITTDLGISLFSFGT